MIKKLFVASILLCSSITSFAQSQINPGLYVVKGGWGDLSINKSATGVMSFSISSVESNGHSCGLDGFIKNGISNIDPEENMKCEIQFNANGKEIEVIPEGPGCNYYCGMRASFDGVYMKVSKQCTPSEISKTREEALNLYRSKNYVGAIGKLEPVLNNCSETLYWINEYWIRNDLAVAYTKVNKNAECSKVLDKLKGEVKMTEDEIKENYPPLEAELYCADH